MNSLAQFLIAILGFAPRIGCIGTFVIRGRAMPEQPWMFDASDGISSASFAVKCICTLLCTFVLDTQYSQCEVAGFSRKKPAGVVDLRVCAWIWLPFPRPSFFVGCLSPSPIFGVVSAAWGNSRGTPSSLWTPPLGLAAIRALSPAQESFHDAGKPLTFENTGRAREN